MNGAFSKRVLIGIASDADEFAALLHDANASLFPRLSQLFDAVGKRAIGVRTSGFFLMMPAQSHFVGEALVSRVPSFATTKADHAFAIGFHERGDLLGLCDHVNLSARLAFHVVVRHTERFTIFSCSSPV